MRCCICGKETEKIKEGMCESCFAKEKSPFSIKKRIKIPVCKHCGAFYLSKWEYGTVQEMIEAAVFYHITPERGFEIVEEINRDGGEDQIRVKFTQSEKEIDLDIELLAVNEFKIVQNLSSKIIIEHTICKRCSRVHGGYYEAILQLRRKDAVLTREEKEEIIDIVRKTNEKEKVSDLKDRKEGIDLYFISKRAAKKVLTLLRSKYGGSIKRSYEVYGQDKSRNITLLRMPQYKKDMIVEYDGTLWVVEKARNALYLRSFTGTKKRFMWRDADSDRFKIIEPVYEDVMITEETPDRVQFMSLKSYETFYLKSKDVPKGINIEIKKEYRAVRRKNKLEIWWDYEHRG
ncbi:MAG: 60S ribosomal export protein NMD3 [Euryarchaeota archaeon]|nr:60S ribosomal export protein NMD3 [Euryarchaeota archaeon]